MRLEDLYKGKAKENKVEAMVAARKENPNNIKEQFLANLPKTVNPENPDNTITPINTRKELAKIAGVSHDTIYKGVAKHDTLQI